MKFLKDLFKAKPETRAVDPSWTYLSGMNTTTGQLVNARTAENLSTVLACVSAISSAVASLPVWIYRLSDQGRDVDKLHPLARLVRQGANAHQSWPDFVEWLLASALLRGNGLAEIVPDARGAVVELRPIPWEWVSVQLLPSGRLAYDIVELVGVYGGQGRPRRLLEGEVLHLRDRSDEGLVGRSRLQRAAAVIAAGLNVQEFAGAMYANGVNPSGALKTEAQLSKEARQHLREQMREMYAGPSNAARFMVLDQGLQWQQISISPEDAELLASRRFTTEELARIYQVPPPLVGIWDHSSFTNSETAGRWFAQHTLTPWIKKLEAEFTRSAFTVESRRTHEIEFDLSGFLRGDHEARWKAHEIAVKNQILTPNEIRHSEGWNPREGGDGFDSGGAK